MHVGSSAQVRHVSSGCSAQLDGVKDGKVKRDTKKKIQEATKENMSDSDYYKNKLIKQTIKKKKTPTNKVKRQKVKQRKNA